MRYANGGGVKKSGTTVNIVVPSARGDGATKAPPIAPAGGMAGMPSPMPSPPPVPPSAGQAGLAALGQPPMMARGGRVKSGKTAQKKAKGGKVAMDAGARSGVGRLENARQYGGK